MKHTGEQSKLIFENIFSDSFGIFPKKTRVKKFIYSKATGLQFGNLQISTKYLETFKTSLLNIENSRLEK